MTCTRSKCAGERRLLSPSPRSNTCTSWVKWGSKRAHFKGPKPPPFDVLRLSALNRLRKNPVLKGHGFSPHIEPSLHPPPCRKPVESLQKITLRGSTIVNGEGPARPNLSGICPVRTIGYPPPPPRD